MGANPGGDSDTAFQEWLNSSSVGTAKAHVYVSKPTLTTDFLAQYDVIVLASLSEDSESGPFWSFDEAEVAAFQEWVENEKGGVIALTGYAGDSSETKPMNQLLAFSGVTYKAEGAWASCSDWTTCGCAGSSTLSTWVKTDPVIADLSNNVSMIGFENGRPITGCLPDRSVLVQHDQVDATARHLFQNRQRSTAGCPLVTGLPRRRPIHPCVN